MTTDPITLRLATPADAGAAIDLVRVSIVELCRPDHGGDRWTLEGWLANKTAENMAHWIDRPGTTVLLAERRGTLAGVAAVTDEGEVLLAYVAPEHRFAGVTKALLARMEEIARGARAERMHVTVTETARAFFTARGYVPEDEPGDIFGADENVLVKPLQAQG